MRNHLTLIVCGALAARLAAGGESWQDKAPADWTDKDIQQILDHSPWVRQATAVFNAERMGGAGGPGSMDPSMGGGPPMGGGPGPGGGGGGMGPGMGGGRQGPTGAGGPGGPGGMQMPIFAIRWASAEPMREALAKSGADSKFGEWAAEYYVITMKGSTGMRPPGGPEQHPDAGDERGNRMAAGLKEATRLKAKGKDAIHPAHVQVIQSQTGQVFAFLFPRSAAISADDNELTFQTALGPMQVKTKFNLKKMTYRGKTAL